MQAEVNRLNSELEAVKLAERRRPNLSTMANRIRRESNPSMPPKPVVEKRFEQKRSALMASDVTTAPPAIRSGEGQGEGDEWSRPTIDADQYQKETADKEVLDPYQ